jgi:hypothetical protein
MLFTFFKVAQEERVEIAETSLHSIELGPRQAPLKLLVRANRHGRRAAELSSGQPKVQKVIPQRDDMVQTLERGVEVAAVVSIGKTNRLVGLTLIKKIRIICGNGIPTWSRCQ